MKVLEIANKKRVLEAIKYNKNIKEKIHININDYKEYSEIYSSIELEIIPIAFNFGRFIEIKKGEESYFHIYFNNKKK